MAHTVTLADARAQFDDLIAEARRGAEVLITDPDGQPVAKLAPAFAQTLASSGERWEAFGLLKGKVELLPGWDEPLEDFKPYTG